MIQINWRARHFARCQRASAYATVLAKMWARTQLKIGWRDLMSGAFACLFPGDHDALAARAEAYWDDDVHTIAAFSVRSGFDLLLQALELEAEDEIIFSALNVKGMIKIVRREGFTAVPLDLDISHMAPTAEQLEAAITPKSKVLVVAHLFGSMIDLEPLFACAKRHGLIIVEDCAQAFDGRAYPGHALADLSLFSFGPLKTSTAMGGALIRVRDGDLCARMREIQSAYPMQKNKAQLKRCLQFSALRLVASRYVLSAIYFGFKLFGRDYEDAVTDRVRGVAKLGSAKRLRYQPSAGLLGLLCRRIYGFKEGSLDVRTAKGELLRDLLGDAVALPGQANAHHNYWVFPVLVDKPAAFVAGLRKLGFDSSGLPRSQAVAAPEGREELEPHRATEALADMIVVPCYPDMSDEELRREAEAIRKIAEETGTGRARRLVSDSKSAADAA